MEIAGKLVKDATVKEVKSGKKVVNFSIVINEYYKGKDGEKKELTTFINYAYWKSEKVAPGLKKGTSVSVSGRIEAEAYKTASGEIKAALKFHVCKITFIGGGKTNAATTEHAAPVVAAVPETVDDLPF